MSTATALRDDLLDKLRSQALRSGQRLPTERALSEQYGLSRTTVRRVLLDFKRRQLITQTVGSGTYVAPNAHHQLAGDALAPQASASPAELMTARLVLEPALIEMVIANATAADFARMDQCNNEAEAAGTLEAFEQWDAALHEAVAEATHNGFIIGVFRLLNQARSQAEWGVLKRRSATPERRGHYQQQHRALVAALKQRDAAEARLRCLEHLRQVRRNMLGD